MMKVNLIGDYEGSYRISVIEWVLGDFECDAAGGVGGLEDVGSVMYINRV